jgi:CHAP domain
MKNQFKYAIVALMLAGCNQVANVEPTQNLAPVVVMDATEGTLPPLFIDKDATEVQSSSQARVAAETLINKVSGRTISQGTWQDVIVMLNSSFDKNATYMCRLYVYNNAQVDLYASDYVGGWRVLAQNTSNSLPIKEITFKLNSGTQTYLKVYGRSGNNVKYDLAVYKISNPEPAPLSYQQSTSNQTTLGHGSIYGYVQGVAVYANGSNYGNAIGRNSVNGIDTGLKWQCVELARRFMLQVYGKQMGAGANAKDFFGNAGSWGMKAHSNGGSVAPQPGDILCYDSRAGGGFGHVAVIIEVTATNILIAQQNIYGDTHVGKRLTRSGNTVSGTGVQGWIRL